MSKSHSLPGRVLHFLGSVKMTVVLLILGVIVMGIGTVLESRTNADFAQSAVYKTFWFDTFLVLIAINLAAAVVNRIPLKRHHLSFVVVHASIILLMAGAWVSRHYGFEGQLPIAEGSGTAQLLLYDKDVVLTGPVNAQRPEEGTEVKRRFQLDPTIFQAGKVLQQEAGGNPGITILDYTSDGFLEIGIAPSDQAVGPGIEYRVSGHGDSVDGWLLADHADYRHDDLGPVEVEILNFREQADFLARLAPAPAQSRVSITAADGEPVFIDLPEGLGQDLDLGSGVLAKVVTFFENARVVDGKLVEDPASGRNPAAVVEVWKGDQLEKHTVFSEFPDFALHQVESEHPLASHVRLEAPNSNGKPMLSFLVAPDGAYRYQITDSGGRAEADILPDEGYVEIGENHFHFELLKFLPDAVRRERMRKADGESGGSTLIKLQIAANGQAEQFWLSQGGSRMSSLLGPNAQLSFRRQTRPLPFRIDLEDFDLAFYPGSRRPSDYSSHVRLAALDGTAAPLATVISMNRPLDYMGYRLFQSSYVLGQGGRPDTTVLSASYDPGVPVVYAAFVLLILGVGWYVLGDGRGKGRRNGQAEVQTDITIIPAPSPATAQAAVSGAGKDDLIQARSEPIT